ncbi:hypothetical protein BDFB_012963, partial [Asbolus verrucosus]
WFIVRKIYSNVYYTHFTLVDNILFTLLDIIFYTHNFYVLVVLMVVKRHQWFKLIHNLQFVECQVNFPHKSHWLAIILAHMVFCAITISGMTVYFVIFDITYVELNFVDCFENYSLFFHTVCTCVVLSLLLSRYKRQILFLKRENINKVHCNMYLLKKSVDIFNDIFGWMILLDVCYGAIKCLTYINLMVKNENIVRNLWLQFYGVSLLTSIWARIVTTILLCDAILKKYEDIFNVAFRIKCSTNNRKFRSILAVVSHNRPEFRAARFFLIDRSLLFSIFDSVTTFTLVILQFKPS